MVANWNAAQVVPSRQPLGSTIVRNVPMERGAVILLRILIACAPVVRAKTTSVKLPERLASPVRSMKNARLVLVAVYPWMVTIWFVAQVASRDPLGLTIVRNVPMERGAAIEFWTLIACAPVVCAKMTSASQKEM